MQKHGAWLPQTLRLSWNVTHLSLLVNLRISSHFKQNDKFIQKGYADSTCHFILKIPLDFGCIPLSALIEKPSFPSALFQLCD